jgi:hypothetical protein
MSGPALGEQFAHEIRGAADRGEYRHKGKANVRAEQLPDDLDDALTVLDVLAAAYSGCPCGISCKPNSSDSAGPQAAMLPQSR